MPVHKGTRPLETNRLHLRRFVLSDEAAVYENWASDPKAAEYLTWRAHGSSKVTHDVLESWCRHYHADTYRWGIIWRETGELVGSVDIVRTKGETGELGYVLSPRFWGMGIVPEAAGAVLRYAFSELCYERMAGEFQAGNTASRRVLEKLGMHETQMIADCYRTNQGMPCTVLRYEISRKEWETPCIRPAFSHEALEIGRLYAELADALRESGRPGPGWKKHVYPRTADAREAWECGELYAAVRSGTVEGTVILNDRQAPAYRDAQWLYSVERALVIHTLAVHPKAGGRGVGKALLSFAEGLARKEGFPVIRLDTYVENVPAIRLYETCGYRLADRVDLGLEEAFGLKWFYTFEKKVE